MRPFMYCSAARSSKRRMSHIVSNISRMTSASGRGAPAASRGTAVLAMRHLSSGVDPPIVAARPGAEVGPRGV